MGENGVLLKYIWLKDYACFEKTEFQLDQNHEFAYSPEEKCLRVSDCKRCLPEKFWDEGGRIAGVYAVVGDNGRGKTSFLRAIMDIFTQVYPPERLSKEQYVNESAGGFQALVIVGEPESKDLQILCIGMGEVSVEKANVDEENACNLHVTADKLKIRDILQEVKIAFLSNVFDMRDYTQPKAEHISDYSFGGLLIRDYSKKANFQREDCHNDRVMEQVFHDIYRQVSFMTECYDKLDDETQREMFSSWPKELRISFVPRKNGRERVGEIRFGEIFIEKLAELVPEENRLVSWKSSRRAAMDFYFNILERYIGFVMKDKASEIEAPAERVKYRLCWETFYNLVIIDEYRSFYKEPNESRHGEKLLPIVTAVYEAIKSAIDSIAEDKEIFSHHPCFFYDILAKKLSALSEAAAGEEPEIARYYADMFNAILSLPEDLFVYDADDFLFRVRGQDKEKIEKFSHFLLCYKKVVAPYSFLEFHWGMSSGENHLLSFYARLFAMRRVQRDTNFHTEQVVNYIRLLGEANQQNVADDFSSITCKSLWLLMDEADLTYHPRWQKKLVADMCRFIPLILPDENLKIEIIFTTHSPILLGDIPGGNVIYLTQEDGKIQARRNFAKNTFGQNIYVLFQDSFFLDDPLGQFASDKLQEIMGDITRIREQLEEMDAKANLNKTTKKESADDTVDNMKDMLNKINDVREKTGLFGDKVIRYKLSELLDVCEYHLHSYRHKSGAEEKDDKRKELEWMNEKKKWIEGQIAKLEKEL